jgi:hypothetical protein
MAMCRPLRASRIMQLTTATTQGAERQPRRQRDTNSGRRLDRVIVDGDEHAAEDEQQVATALRDETKKGRRLKRQHDTKSGRSHDSGGCKP